MQGGQQIGFPLKIFHDSLTHQWIWCANDHFFDGNQFGHTWEMHVTGTINRSHTAKTDNFLDQIPVRKGDTGLKLRLGRSVLIAVVIV